MNSRPQVSATNRRRMIAGALVFLFVVILALMWKLGLTQAAKAPEMPLSPFTQATYSASACAAIEIPLHLGDPFAVAYNPVNDYVYVLRTGTRVTQTVVVVLHYGREAARINIPPVYNGELTSIGVNPHSGWTYVTQWANDNVHFVSGTQRVGSGNWGYWGPAGVWPNPLSNVTYISGKWIESTSKVIYYNRTARLGITELITNANPNAGVVAENNQHLYLANSNVDTVSVITDTALLTTINVGDHPNGIAYNPTNGYVYVVNRGTTATSSTVSVISDTTVAATVTLGTGYSTDLGVDPKDAITLQGNIYSGSTDIMTVDPTTGYVYVSNWGAGTVSVISGTALLTTLSVGTNPNSIVYNPVTGLVYVANTASNTVTLIEGTSVIKTVPVGNYPIDLAADTNSGLVYAVNRDSDTLSIIRCEDNQPEKRVLGHYMTWYKTPTNYSTPACVNPDARGEWRMWNARCGHDPDVITGTHGFRDIAAVHYPLIGPYDSADPKVIEYHLLQALAAEVDTFVIDYYGENDSGGIDEASLQVLQQVEAMNAAYGTHFKLALMYDEGALEGQPDPVAKAISDTAYILRTYASSPAYLWADGKPVLFYFPKGSPLSATQLLTITQDFALVYQNFPDDYLAVMNGSYAWVKAEPWKNDGTDWGQSYLDWYYREFDFRAGTVPTLTFDAGSVWAGFDDIGVGAWISPCNEHRWIDRQDGQVYDWTWDVLDDYNEHIGISYTLPISWVQLATLNDYMEGTTLFASVEVTGIDGTDYGYGYGYQYVQKTEDHAQEFKALPTDDKADIYVAQHIYNARLASGTSSNAALIEDALDAFHSGDYTLAMTLADEAAGIPAPTNLTGTPDNTSITVAWQDYPTATLASGHRVYYGLAPGQYTSSITVSSGSSATISGLVTDTTYYIAVATLGITHPCEPWYVSESWYSDEIALSTPLIVTRSVVSKTWQTFGDTCARLYFTETGSVSVVSVTLAYTYPTAQTTDRPLPRRYDITSNGSGFAAMLAVCYADDEWAAAGIAQESDLQLYRYEGGGDWLHYPSLINTTTNLITATQVTSFSTWAIGAASDHEPNVIILREPGLSETHISHISVWISVGVLFASVGWMCWRRRKAA